MSDKSYFDGVLMAYDDCAKFAKHLSENTDQILGLPGLQDRDLQILKLAARTILAQFSSSIADKAQNARDMIKAAENGWQ